MYEKKITTQSFDELIGTAATKKVCEFTLQVCELKTRQPNLPIPHLVLSMPPGEGFTTIAATVADTLFQSHVVKTPHSLSRFLDYEVSEEDTDLGGLNELLREASSITNAYDGIIACDLKVSLHHLKPEYLIRVLKEQQALWILRVSPADLSGLIPYLRRSGRDFQILRLPALTERELAEIALKNYHGTEQLISSESAEILVSGLKKYECTSLHCINTALNDMFFQNNGKVMERTDVQKYIKNVADLHSEMTKNTIGFTR